MRRCLLFRRLSPEARRASIAIGSPGLGPPNTIGKQAMRTLSSSFVVRIVLRILVAFVVCVSAGRADGPEKMTPLLLDMQDAPAPFMGSDGRVRLVYELWMTNFSSADILVEKVEVLGDVEVLR